MSMAEKADFACIDAHMHVDKYDAEERDGLLEEAFGGGVDAIVAVSMDMNSCHVNRELSLKYPGRVHPAYGWHPEQEPLSDSVLDRLVDWIRERHAAGEAFAIGEVGLPYYRRMEAEQSGQRFDETPYMTILERFVQLAAELDRPIALHAVYEDADKTCGLLEQHRVRRAHFHWFKGSDATLQRMAEAGYRISITPDVAYEEEIIRIVRQYPLELMMTETDGPWPFDGLYAGQATKPAMAADAARHIAAIKGLPVAETSAILLANAQSFYGIERGTASIR